MLSRIVAYIDAYRMWELFDDFFGKRGDTNTRNIENSSPHKEIGSDFVPILRVGIRILYLNLGYGTLLYVLCDIVPYVVLWRQDSEKCIHSWKKSTQIVL